MKIAAGILVLLVVLYTGTWFGIAQTLDKQIQTLIKNSTQDIFYKGDISKIYGFPGSFKINLNGVLTFPDAKVSGKDIHIEFSPIPNIPSKITAPKGFTVTSDGIEETFTSGHADAHLTRTLFGITEKQLRKFQAKDGRLLIDNIILTQNEISVMAEGELSLDNNLQPQGTLAAEIREFGAIIKKLREYDVINSDQANIATLASLALTRQDETGQAYVTTPLFLKNQELYLGPVLIIQLKTISW